VKRLIGIYREKEYSPGAHESNDAVVLEAVAERLRESGFALELISAAEVNGAPHCDALVLSMCQGTPALEKLAKWERNGTKIVNSPSAARNTHRDRLPGILEQAGIPFPRTTLVPTGRKLNGEIPHDGGLWLKRGDVHASVAADVQRFDSFDELANALGQFNARGIATAAVQTHCAGDEIKFYGVGGGEFFHWFYSREGNGYAFEETSLKSLATRAAEAAGLDVFGGDVIVSPDGALTLIDLNDWPSFAPCRDAAAEAIANLITRRANGG
jgi:glutathione synthase/RimK-type ligase-like ATP-grasp enzyme